MRDPDFTLSAGPTMAWPQVLAAQGKQITYHYDPAFLEAFRRTEQQGGGDLPHEDTTSCSCRARPILGLEAAARGLVRPGTPVLNLVSGVFGKGMGYWLKDFGAELHELEVPYNDSVDPADVERYLDEHPEIELVTVVHSETPSGTLHDLAAIGPIAHAHGAMTIVDCVSSLGGIEFRTDEWQIDIAVAARAEVPRRASRHHADDRQRRRVGADPREPGGAARLVPVDARLEGAVDRRREVPVHAVGRRHARHRGRAATSCSRRGSSSRSPGTSWPARACRAGVRAMGLELWPRSEEVDGRLRDRDHRARRARRTSRCAAHCRERYGVMISGGQGAGNLVRIGHMGPTASSIYPVVGLAARRAHVGRPRRLGEGRRRRRRRARGARRRRRRRVRVTLPPFELHRPQTVEEATELADALRRGRRVLLRRHGAPTAAQARASPPFGHLVDLKGIDELAGIRAENGGLVVGATVTHRELERSRARARAAARARRRWSGRSRTSACARSARSAETSASPTRTPIPRRSCSRWTRRSSAGAVARPSRRVPIGDVRRRPVPDGARRGGAAHGRSRFPRSRGAHGSPTRSSPSTSARQRPSRAWRASRTDHRRGARRRRVGRREAGALGRCREAAYGHAGRRARPRCGRARQATAPPKTRRPSTTRLGRRSTRRSSCACSSSERSGRQSR